MTTSPPGRGSQNDHGGSSQNDYGGSGKNDYPEVIKGSTPHHGTKADAVAGGSVSDVDRFDPDSGLEGASSSSASHSNGKKPDDDDRSPEKNNSKSVNSKATSKRAQGLAKFEATHPNEVSRQELEWALDAIESRSEGKPISSANYYFKALENEFFETEFESEPNAGSLAAQEIVKPPKPQKQSYFEQAVSGFTDLLARSGMSLESARAKVLELVNEEGKFDSWENCRTLCGFVSMNNIPGIPEPRENGQTVWMPETFLEFMELLAFASPSYSEFGAWNEACRYFSRKGKFASPEKRRAFEDKLPTLLQKKLAHDANEARLERNRKGRRERRAARKAGNQNARRDHGESER